MEVDKKLERLNKKWHTKVMSWVTALWCSDWEVTTVVADPESFNADRHSDGQDFASAAYSYTTPSYKLAHIVVNRENFERALSYDLVELDRLACHEVTHIVLSQLDAFAEDLIDELPKVSRQLAFKRWRTALEDTASHLQRALSRMRAYSEHLEQEAKKTSAGYVPINDVLSPAMQSKGRVKK